MKKSLTIVLIACLALVPLIGIAQTNTAIEMMNEQPLERWTQTYETKWRTVEIDVQPLVPQVSKFPILAVVADFEYPDTAALGDGWVCEMDETATFRATLNGNGDDEVIHAEKKLGGISTSSLYYPPFDMERVYAENSSISLGAAIQQFKDQLVAMGEDPEDWQYTRPHEMHCFKTANKAGEILLPGMYAIMMRQQLQGIPLFCHVALSTDTPSRQNAEYDSNLLLTMPSLDKMFIGWRKVKTIEVVAEDVPLCDFSTIQATLEAEIEAGHIRKIFDMELGYGLYNEPGATREPDHPASAQYYAVPVWQVYCFYTESAKKELRDYSELDVPERGSMDCRRILINAQTGEMLSPFGRSNNRDDYKGFISW